jgi:SRSO17 transposase
VQRQYSGTAGRTENCQLGVFLAYVSSRGRAPLDVRLYLPNKTWAADRARCTAAGVPGDVGFATKPALARDMIEKAWAAGLPFAWLTGDEVYGRDPKLAAWAEEHRIGYVFAVDCDRQVSTATGRFRVDTLAARVPARAWQPYAAADGAKGPRLFDWALIATTDTPAGATQPRCVLARRSRTDPGELAYYLCHAPRPVPMATFVAVAGCRWAVEEIFQAGKNEVGYDHYQVRLYHAWYRHLTLAMLAHAWLAATAARAGAGGSRPELAWEPTGPTATGYTPGPGGSLPLEVPAAVAECELVPLSVNEIRRLYAAFHRPHHPPGHTLHWSRWRRRHQARARRCHYQRRIRDQRHRDTRRPATPTRDRAP